jgi:hypothetical protein
MARARARARVRARASARSRPRKREWGEGKGKVEGRVNICQLIQLKQNKNIDWIKTLLEQFDPINF